MSSMPRQAQLLRDRGEELQKAAYEPTDGSGSGPATGEGVEGKVEPAPDPATVTAPAPKVEDFEHKYNTIRGMYNADNARNRQTIAELNEANNRLAERLAALEQQAPKAEAPKATPTAHLTDKDREEWGEVIEVMERLVQGHAQQLESRIAELEAKLSKDLSAVVPKVQQIEQVQHMSEREKFWQALYAAVPNVREVNDNPDFHAWLWGVDPMTGYVRQDILKHAESTLNVEQVAFIFKTWESTQTPSTPAPAPAPARSELEMQVSPGKARATPAPAAPDNTVVSRDEIAAFYKDVSLGKYRGKETEKLAMEQRIFKAANEGRAF